MKRIILASTSPRRKEIFSKLKIPFETKESNYKEDMTLEMSPVELVEFLSFNKAKAIVSDNRDAVIIAADTIVAYQNKVLGKPKTEKEAKEMLMMLSGKENQIITGVTIMENNHSFSFHETAQVYMEEMSIEEIDKYIATGEPMDKAGAYALQEIGSVFIKKIDGDFYTAMGLPLKRLVCELKNFGINIL
ncbi:Maf family protein [bacterium]|jgi:septum formation protein|nr:Maf family protein [bacterium]